MNISEVNDGITKNKLRRRIGRGPGSGQGKTAGRGHNGHKSRSGYSRHPVFQGGDLPLVRRIPKRGFNNKFALTVVSINLGQIAQVFDAGDEITPKTLQARGVIKRRFDEIKVLGDGEITKPLKISAHRFSASALEKLQAVGGSATVVKARRTPKQRVAELASQAGKK
ncbi:MAG: 50S ribosomal protein L15 [Pirellulaceae bacterium]|nr:50S ribosomal protein L15 [Pirellulaceae bacterium]